MQKNAVHFKLKAFQSLTLNSLCWIVVRSGKVPFLLWGWSYVDMQHICWFCVQMMTVVPSAILHSLSPPGSCVG